MKNYTSVKDQVEFGLDTIDSDRRVSVRLRDLMYLHNMIGEFVRFFHQPMHYPTLSSVEKFLGDSTSDGAINVLWETYYRKLPTMLPQDIHDAFNEGVAFRHPNPPYYYDPDQA